VTIALKQVPFRGGPWDGETFPAPDPPCPRFMLPVRAEDGTKMWHAYKWSVVMEVYLYQGVEEVITR
jgi:hypothetical protein